MVYVQKQETISADEEKGLLTSLWQLMELELSSGSASMENHMEISQELSKKSQRVQNSH